MMNWANNLDMLAQNGVLDYDAASYIMGQPPRYVGNPVMPSPFAGQPPVAPNMQQPEIDEFKPSKDKNDIVKNPSWKKWAFALITASAFVFGGWKFKSKFLPFIRKNLLKTKSFIQNNWNKLINVFKKKTP